MPKTILIVDDEPNVRAGLVDILQELGYSIVEAENGQEAIEKARAIKPDLVLLATSMPGMDGIEICRQIKQVEKISTRVIVYTAKLTAIDAVKARRNGTDDFCVKGENPEHLLKAIKTLI